MGAYAPCDANRVEVVEPLLNIGRLPNLRDLIIPDPGYTIIDMDLDRADLWVLQRESGDSRLREKLEDEKKGGQDIHTANALSLFGQGILDAQGVAHPEKRRFAKVFCHGADYGAKAATLAKQCGISIKLAEASLLRWFGEHTGILSWQGNVKQQVRSSMEMRNKYGYRIKFFGRWEDHVNDALAWVPASTVALTIHKTTINIHRHDPWIEVLLNGHDSLTTQVPTSRLEEGLATMERHSRIVIPYEEPLIIPIGFSTSDKSWGQVKELKNYAYQH